MIDKPKTLHEALFAFQGKVHGVVKDSKNPHFKNTYASLQAVCDTVRPHFQELGLYWKQTPGHIVDGSLELRTDIIFVPSGEIDSNVMHVPLPPNPTPQQVGSAITYGCRYSLMAMLGLPPTDDDAEAAVGRSIDPQEASERWGDRRGAELQRAVRARPHTQPNSVPPEDFPI